MQPLYIIQDQRDNQINVIRVVYQPLSVSVEPIGLCFTTGFQFIDHEAGFAIEEPENIGRAVRMVLEKEFIFHADTGTLTDIVRGLAADKYASRCCRDHRLAYGIEIVELRPTFPTPLDIRKNLLIIDLSKPFVAKGFPLK